MEIQRHSISKWISNGCFSASQKSITGYVEIHWHDFFEIELILSGGGEYIMDGVIYPIEAGSLYIMSPGSFHEINFQRETELINVMFTVALCSSDYLPLFFSHQPHRAIRLTPEQATLIRALLSEAVACSNTRDELLTRYISGVLNTVILKGLLVNGDGELSENAPICRAIMYINSSFTKKISLSDASAIAGYTPNYFGNKFKSQTGKTFKQYLTDLRFSFARHLLGSTNLSVGEICEKSGFSDLSNFIYSFKSRYGTTPRSYRRNCEGKDSAEKSE